METKCNHFPSDGIKGSWHLKFTSFSSGFFLLRKQEFRKCLILTFHFWEIANCKSLRFCSFISVPINLQKCGVRKKHFITVVSQILNFYSWPPLKNIVVWVGWKVFLIFEGIHLLVFLSLDFYKDFSQVSSNDI